MPYYRKKPIPVTELKEGDIIYSPYNIFRVKKVTEVQEWAAAPLTSAPATSSHCRAATTN